MSETPEPTEPRTEPSAEQPSVELRPIGSRSSASLPPNVDLPPGDPESGPIGSGRGRHTASDSRGDAPAAGDSTGAAPPAGDPRSEAPAAGDATGAAPPAPPSPPPAWPAAAQAAGARPEIEVEIEVEIVDAEIVDERPRPMRPEDLQTDEWVTVPTPPTPPPPAPPYPVAASAPAPYPQSPMGQPPRPRGPQGMPPGPPAPRPQHGPGSGPRPGLPARQALPSAPGLMVADTWDTSPLPPVGDEYEGRRRRGLRRGSRPGRAGWLVVLGVVLSLSAAVAVPFIITAPGTDDDTSAAPTGGRPGTSAPAGTSGVGPSGLPINVAPSETPSAAPTPSLNTSASGSPSGATSAPATTPAAPLQPPGAPAGLQASNFEATSVNLAWTASSGTVSQYLIERCQGATCTNFTQVGTATGVSFGSTGLAASSVYRFRVRAGNGAGNSPYSGIIAALTTLTLEAEAGARSGCAQVSNFNGASGGQIVNRIGGDWSGCSGDGVVTFSNLSLPAGTFVVSVYHVFVQPTSDSQRYARLRLDPTASGSNIDFARYYPQTTTVQGWTSDSFTVGSAATFTVYFSNPGVQGQDRAPALDRIVIQQTN